MVKPIALLALVAACAAPRIVPQVVVAVTPYVATVPLPPNDSTVWGRVKCDLAGQPYILVLSTLTPEQVGPVILHERLHVQQIRAFGSCRAFAERYQQDSIFRLHVEADAYCGVIIAQRQMKIPVEPTFDQVVDILMQKYESEYTKEAVLAALPCG